MFFENQTDLDLITRALVLGPVALLWIIALTRLVGLRSFSKMTSFDFVATVAIGSMLASAATATEWSAFIQAAIAITAIASLQVVLALARRFSEKVSKVIENEPLMLVDGGKWNEQALAHTRVDECDVWAKLREANVIDVSSLKAVVLETTGDISVLHGESLDRTVLKGVNTQKFAQQ